MKNIKKLKDQNKILIFYQSIVEITFILNLLKKYSYGKCVLIVTGGEHFISVIKKLNIEKNFGVRVFLFSGLSLKNPFNLIKMYLNVYYSYESKELSNYNFEKTYFFTEYEDFITPIFLSKKNINNIILIDSHSKLFSKKKNKISFKNYIKINLIKILHIHINIKTNFYSYKYSRKNSFINQFPKYYLYKKKIKKISPKKVNFISDLRLKLDSKILKKKNIMYIDSNDEEMIGDEFKTITDKIFNFFINKKYNIVIKRPTRENLSPSLDLQSKFNYIYDSTPIELYDLSKFQFVFGFMTTALSKISERNENIKVFSIVNFLSKKKRNFFSKVVFHFQKINKLKKGKIFYPENLQSLININ